MVYMNLSRMRKVRFTEKYIDSVWQTARSLPLENMSALDSGEQQFINNFFRFFPASFQQLP